MGQIGPVSVVPGRARDLTGLVHLCSWGERLQAFLCGCIVFLVLLLVVEVLDPPGDITGLWHGRREQKEGCPVVADHLPLTQAQCPVTSQRHAHHGTTSQWGKGRMIGCPVAVEP